MAANLRRQRGEFFRLLVFSTVLAVLYLLLINWGPIRQTLANLWPDHLWPAYFRLTALWPSDLWPRHP